MIKTAEEFKQLRSSENLNEQRRADIEEASIETWKEIINKYPDLKGWVVYNKTVPLEILNQLSADPSPRVRSEVALKRKIDIQIFNRLKNDEDENVKLSLLYNTKITDELKNQIDSNGSIWYQRQIFIKRRKASDKQKEIQLFGYNKYWIELGIVNKSKIEEDLYQFKIGDDPDPDHFRYRRVIYWLQNKTETNELEFDILCELVENDIDFSFANHVVEEFYSSNFLNEDQISILDSKIENLSPFLKSFVQNNRIKRKIITNELSEAEVIELIENKSNSLLRLLVDATFDMNILSKLSEYKGSTKIRNVATIKIKKAGNK